MPDADTKMMHQKYEDEFVTPTMCDMHHKVMEAQLEVLRQKDKNLEEKISGVEKRLDSIDEKMNELLGLQQKLNNYLLYLAVGIILTLIGVLTGRALDFGWLI